MIADDWVDINFDNEINKNWERLFVKLQHKFPIEYVSVKMLKPKGLANVLQMHNNRFISPPYIHPYNLRRLEQRQKIKNKM